MGYDDTARPRPVQLIIRIIRAAIATLIVLIVRAVANADSAVQDAATRLRFHRLPILRHCSPGARQIFARLFFPITVLLLFFTYHTHENNIITRGLKIPILGSAESHVNLYFPPIGGNFQPPVPFYNEAPKIRARTPLFIPFTRNDTMLRQAVLSYIASGWPREDIVIVDNSGTMDSNNRGYLSAENPFRIDYDLFRGRYGVAILQTPTLLNFAQLQNFMLRQALARDWPFYFWSHMDVAILGAEEFAPYKSFYQRVLDVLYGSGMDAWDVSAPEADLSSPEGAPLYNTSSVPDWGANDDGQGRFKAIAAPTTAPLNQDRPITKRFLKQWPKKNLKWAVKFFDFDNLVLVNVAAWQKIGAWDTFIPYYNTDCDYYGRLVMHGYRRDEHSTGYVFDIAGIVEDPENRFFPGQTSSARKKWGMGPSGADPEPQGGKLNSWRYQWLHEELSEMMRTKNTAEGGRNSWQDQAGALATKKPVEPWTYDTKAFQTAWWDTAASGRIMFIKKWGTFECNIKQVANKKLGDEWNGLYLQPGTEGYRAWKEEEHKWLEYVNDGPIR